MKKTVILLIATTFLSKIIAFGKELVLAYYYGTGHISDAYLMALTIPVVILGFFSSGISSGFVPAYRKAIGDELDLLEGNKFTNEIITVLVLASFFLIALYFSLNHAVVDFFAKGFDDAEKIITLEFSNVMIFAIIFSCITTVMRSFLQSNEKTTVLGLVSIPLNIGLAIAIVLSDIYNNIYILPYGYLISCIAQASIFVVIAKNNGYTISKKISFWNENVQFFLSSIILLTIGSSVYLINVLVDKMLASTISVGGVASLEYGNRILDLISGLFIIAISTVYFPGFVNHNKDKRKISMYFREGIENLALFLIPLSLVLMFFSKEIVTLVYARGAFGEKAIESTSLILSFYGIGLIAIGIRELVSKLYYALGEMRTPLINAVMGVTLNVILNFVLIKNFGLGGLAFATSISAIVMAISLLIQIREKINLQFQVMFYMRVLLLSILSSFICKMFIELIMIQSYHVKILIGLVAFAIIYLIGLFLIGILDLKAVRRLVKQ